MTHIVVVGGGQAAQSLVTKLRKDGFGGEVTLIGEEPVPPYQRPPLSKKYLLGELQLERLFLRPAEYYADNDITLVLGKRASAIDPTRKAVRVEGDTLHYDQLVLATGAVPRRLPAAIGGDLEGVYTVRKLADVDAMAPEFRPGRHLLVVGGGYIGLEAAAVAARKGLKVTLIEMADRILQRVASPETAAYIREVHRSEGVDIREKTGLARLVGDGRVEAAELDDGTTLAVDFVIVGIGITPDTRLAEDAGIAVENGIRVDEFGRTSVADIWAAGDCASFPWQGGRLRLESVGNAIDMGELVAANIMGAEQPYVAKPWFWSDQFDMKLQIAGLNTGYDRVVTRPGEADGAISFWYYAGSKLLAVDAINDPRAYMIGKRLVEAGQSPSPEDVGNRDVALKSLLGT